MASCWIITLSLSCIVCATMAHAQRTFAIQNDQFVLDGKPMRLLSADIHYFRIPRPYWADRLLRLKAMGLNSVQVYVPWNVHQPDINRFDFQGRADLLGFLQLAHSLDFLVLLRPGPYICAEWEFGGFPSWLQSVPNIVLRSSDAVYLSYVDSYMSVLLSLIQPMLYANGGPIIMVQLENEYGSYGDDHAYKTWLRDFVRPYVNNSAVLYTTDGAADRFLTSGVVEGVYAVGDFGPGTDVAAAFELQKTYNAPASSPPFCSEFYTGWLTHWGEKMAQTSTQALINTLKDILAYHNGASVNLYMGFGGSNFGFMNGANLLGDVYQPTITSYDYDAPISEAGDLTDKYFAIRDVLSQYATSPVPSPPAPLPKTAYGSVTLQATSFAAALASIVPIRSAEPLTMEALSQDYGFILYRTQIHAAPVDRFVNLTADWVRDRAVVLVNGVSQGVLYRNDNTSIQLSIEKSDVPAVLELLVENMGRVNYFDSGTVIDERKGLQHVRLDGTLLVGEGIWAQIPLPFTSKHLQQIEEAANSMVLKTDDGGRAGPKLYRGILSIDSEPTDTFISMEGWTKGVVFVNSHNIGRYWETVGPQHTLYIPADFLKQGPNSIFVFELHDGNSNGTVVFDHKPYFDYESRSLTSGHERSSF
eukprot:GILJ01010427.1.p1 GENE.GILJ01010427.1~~GILJ01010427.1.p1  ORF type:complete len:645 (-),score=55.68 GILJ01010427.1:621-2555(-)